MALGEGGNGDSLVLSLIEPLRELISSLVSYGVRAENLECKKLVMIRCKKILPVKILRIISQQSHDSIHVEYGINSLTAKYFAL